MRSVAVERTCPTMTLTERFAVSSRTIVACAAARRAGSTTSTSRDGLGEDRRSARTASASSRSASGTPGGVWSPVPIARIAPRASTRVLRTARSMCAPPSRRGRPGRRADRRRRSSSSRPPAPRRWPRGRDRRRRRSPAPAAAPPRSPPSSGAPGRLRHVLERLRRARRSTGSAASRMSRSTFDGRTSRPRAGRRSRRSRRRARARTRRRLRRAAQGHRRAPRRRPPG